MKQGEDKVLRVLDTYDNLINGKLINKRDISQKFNVSEKSIQRDIFEINNSIPYLNIFQTKQNLDNFRYPINFPIHVFLPLPFFFLVYLPHGQV